MTIRSSQNQPWHVRWADALICIQPHSSDSQKGGKCLRAWVQLSGQKGGKLIFRPSQSPRARLRRPISPPGRGGGCGPSTLPSRPGGGPSRGWVHPPFEAHDASSRTRGTPSPNTPRCCASTNLRGARPRVAQLVQQLRAVAHPQAPADVEKRAAALCREEPAAVPPALTKLADDRRGTGDHLCRDPCYLDPGPIGSVYEAAVGWSTPSGELRGDGQDHGGRAPWE